MITGLNHLTLAVSDLPRSLKFYQDVLGMTCVSTQGSGAYLCAGDLWLCLSLDQAAATATREDYTHVAFSIDADAFADFETRLSQHDVPIWQSNRSEGLSIYFLDPDGHKLEVHVGDLSSRLRSMRTVQGTVANGPNCPS